MALKPSLTLRIGQQLRMTPQLQQAIRLLQLSSIELEAEIQEALDSNFMLEEVDQGSTDDDHNDSTSTDDVVEVEPDIPEPDISHDISDDISGDIAGSPDTEEFDIPNPELDGETVPDLSQEVSSESMSDELPVDTTWDDVIDENFQASTPGSDFSDENYLETLNAQSITIQSHLMEQINLLNLTETD